MAPRDHPRVCGEHSPSAVTLVSLRGSSPRMRGTLIRPIRLITPERIIPAYAGNTLSKCPTRHGTCGSSPRMRGTRVATLWILRATGIIPAYAGNTWRRSPRRHAPEDHPRVCGEHPTIVNSRSDRTGSSPRMRGTLSELVHCLRGFGIIPAYAGNTRRNIRRILMYRDHPRVCGEHLEDVLANYSDPGSSPRMRGTPEPLGHLRRVPGIIPAYAGNTRCRALPSVPDWDHPRVCGEHTKRLA